MAERIAWEGRAAAYSGLARGRSALELSDTLGVARMTINRWAESAGMEIRMGHHGGVTPVPVDADPPQSLDRSYRQFSLTDRSFIQAVLTLPEPWPIRALATELEVAPSVDDFAGD